MPKEKTFFNVLELSEEYKNEPHDTPGKTWTNTVQLAQAQQLTMIAQHLGAISETLAEVLSILKMEARKGMK